MRTTKRSMIGTRFHWRLLKIGVNVACIALQAQHAPRQQQAPMVAPIATTMHSQQAVQASVVALFGTEVSQVMVNEVLSSEAVDVENALEFKIDFSKLRHVSQADQLAKGNGRKSFIYRVGL